MALATAAQSLPCQTPRSAIPLSQRLFQAVRPLMTGDTAYDVTAFLDRRWRVPGNRGFDESMDRVIATLRAAGYAEEQAGTASGRLTFRVERYPRRFPTWEPDSASLTIVGDSAPLLRFATNFNMVAMYSFPTPPEGVEGELYEWRSRGDTSGLPRSLAGKIVVGDMSPGRLFVEAVQRRGALGVLAYEMLPYNRPEVNRTAIQDGFVPRDTLRRAFGIMLSREARDRLSAAMSRGPARVRVAIATRMWPSEERTLVAEARGASLPDERFVFSAHLNEAGANDNASGTGALAEMARVLAVLLRGHTADPLRTVTMIWGSEISSTQRYLSQDSARLRGVRWGMSLDMVGENTSVTGGSFLLEKMPDPSAVWTRGEDRHSEWGGRPISVRDIRPHYYNDFVLNRCRDQGAAAGWAVSANPYEGGSDHVPFLLANKPAVQLWHFTDQFYHTDLDRIDKVSRSELANVGSCALVIALTLASADGPTARAVVADIEASAIRRLDTELALSRAAVAGGRPAEPEALIVTTWGNYYRDGIRAAADIEAGGSSAETLRAVEAAALRVERAAASRAGSLRR